MIALVPRDFEYVYPTAFTPKCSTALRRFGLEQLKMVLNLASIQLMFSLEFQPLYSISMFVSISWVGLFDTFDMTGILPVVGPWYPSNLLHPVPAQGFAFQHPIDT